MNGGTEGRPGVRHTMLGILVGLAALSVPGFAHAASLFVAPSTGQFGVGKTFSVVLRVNSAGQSINAVEGVLSFTPSQLQVVSVTSPGSIFNLSVQDPQYSNTAGTVTWTGVILNPGYTGASGNLITVTFRATAQGTAKVNYASGAILANDGQGTNVLSGTSGGVYTIGPAAAPTPATTPAASGDGSAPSITSTTHPDSTKWYSDNDPKFRWTLPPDVDAVSYLVNPKADANPGNTPDGKLSSASFTDVQDGASYFHLKFRSGGAWGPIAHYAFKVDTAPPDAFAISRVDELDPTEPQPKLAFSTADALSGVAQYQMQLNDGDWFTVQPGTHEQPSAMPLTVPGTYTVTVEATDAAGNATRATTAVTVASIPAPVIEGAPASVARDTAFTVVGTAPSGLQVRIRARRTDGAGRSIISGDEPAAEAETKAAGDGTWSAEVRGLSDGAYLLEANAIDSRGAVSDPSNQVQVNVGSSWVSLMSLLRSVTDGWYWLSVLAWFLILINMVAIIRWLWIIYHRRWTAVLVRKRGHSLVEEIQRIVRDIDTELGHLKRISGNRPLYPEEKYLQSKLSQYRRNLRYLAFNVREVAKK